MWSIRRFKSCSLVRLRVAFTVAVFYFGCVLYVLVSRQNWTRPEPEKTLVPTPARNETCEEQTSWNFRSSLPVSVSPSVDITLEGGDKFQQINTFNAYVYSAYVEPVVNDVYNITILGVTDVHYQVPVFCHVGTSKNKTLLKGGMEVLPESHDNSTGTVSFFCSYKAKVAPVTVSLTFKSTDVPTNELRIAYPQTQRRVLTTCYAVLFNYLRSLQLIHSIEINRALGAEHFYVYNHSVSNTTDAVLRHYQNLGILTVLQWLLPPSDVWYHGQVLAINDCVYRNRFVSRLVAVHDTDELILPLNHNTLPEVIESAKIEASVNDTPPGSVLKKPVGTFVFESTLHFAMPDMSAWRAATREFSVRQEERDFILNHCITPLLLVKRMEKVFKFNYRTKAIVRPELVKVAGIHFSHQHRGQATTLVVRNDLAILHHYNPRLYYRNQTFQKDGSVLDSSIFRFTHQIVARLENVFRAVGLT